jgi:hypothetical protein
MRHSGPYAPAAVPTIAELFALSTADRVAQLMTLLPGVQAACVVFTQAIPDVHTLQKMRASQAEADTLIDGYDSRTAAIKRRLANMRASLAPEHADLCPYCSLDSNPDLDHYLPKVKYPDFSLYPYNLIPICTPCNRKKSTAVANRHGERQFLMATYDTCAGVSVLKAEVSFQGAMHARYYIDPHAPLPAAQLSLIGRHFEKLDLATRYRKRAHSHLSAVKRGLGTGTRASRRHFLATNTQNLEVSDPANGWGRALYRGLTDRLDETLDWLQA